MKYVILVAIRFYQKFLTRFTPPCPMEMCCSDYGMWAIKRYGARTGLELTVARIKRCGVQDAVPSQGRTYRDVRDDTVMRSGTR